MITLYHGSPFRVPAPLVSAGRKNLDFGQGFYLTRLREQAEAWAVILSSRQKEAHPFEAWLNIYEFDLAYAKPNHQICLRNQTLIDRHLHHVGSHPITLEEKGGIL